MLYLFGSLFCCPCPQSCIMDVSWWSWWCYLHNCIHKYYNVWTIIAPIISCKLNSKVGDVKVSLRDLHELGSRLIHLKISSSYFTILRLNIFMEFLTKIWWALRILHQIFMRWRLNLSIVNSHIFYPSVSKKQLQFAEAFHLRNALFPSG